VIFKENEDKLKSTKKSQKKVKKRLFSMDIRGDVSSNLDIVKQVESMAMDRIIKKMWEVDLTKLKFKTKKRNGKEAKLLLGIGGFGRVYLCEYKGKKKESFYLN